MSNKHERVFIFIWQTTNTTGKQDFIRDFAEGFGDPESALEEWERLEVVGNFKMDFIV